MLYAGKASLIILLLKSFKYSILNYIVKKLKEISIYFRYRCQSAGNIIDIINKDYINNNNGTSETLRNGIKYNNIINKHINIHINKHMRPLDNIQFGYYLSGLIDSNGEFNNLSHLIILFNKNDIKLTYYLKSTLGYGIIRNIKNQNKLIFIIKDKKGIFKVLNLINNKIRNKTIYNQICDNVLINSYFKELNINKDNFHYNNTYNYNNYWIAGIIDGTGIFSVNINKYSNNIELYLKINHINYDILNIFIRKFGGYIQYNNDRSSNKMVYVSMNYNSVYKIIKYLDRYHLQSNMFIDYLKWRKIYVILQENKHFSFLGMNRIVKLKESIINV